MSYFLPSYFQKRLLRYALTRLDFIDSDELDLDNLGLTWGQRTVVELKNVGIRVKRLRDILQIPPSVILTHASIRLLRLTLPADLHISGIEVEVDGVEILVGIRADKLSGKPDISSTKGGSAPSKTDRANLPRSSSPAVHDPGGRPSSQSPGRHLELSQVIPTSEDLATSFLKDESPDEREELQAALESQSLYMQESVSSAPGEDVGLGMPGGLSLPTFVANFLKGVAGRLSVKVTNVSVLLDLDLSVGEGSQADHTKFLLSIATIVVEPLPQSGEAGVLADMRRSVAVDDINMFVLSESETLSEISGLSSPRISKSRPKLSRPNAPSDSSYQVRSSSASLSQQSDRGKPSSSQHSPAFGLGLDHLSLSDQGPSNHGRKVPVLRQSSDDMQLIAHSEHAEGSIGSPSHYSEQGAILEEARSEDLMESRLYTHDEAESMYMSAVSGEVAMPGGWASSNIAAEAEEGAEDGFALQSSSHSVEHSSNGASVDNINIKTPPPETPLPSIEPEVFTGERLLKTHLASYFRSRILGVNSACFKIPEPHSRANSSEIQRPDSSQRPSRTQALHHSRPSIERGVRSTYLGDSRVRDPQPPRQTQSFRDLKDTFSARIGQISVDLDIVVCKILVKANQAISGVFPATDSGPSAPSATTASLPPEIIVQKVDLNFFETVPKISPAQAAVKPMESIMATDPSLFKLSFATIACTPLSAQDGAQRWSISKIIMTHGATEVLSFVDSINVRDSIATSSMLRPHDFVATISKNRYEVQIKPVHIVLDLLVIDDVLSRSGGLSSLLDLGNSIMSANTVKGIPTKPAPATGRPRTVRFTDSQRRPRAESDPVSPLPKVDVRVSGSLIDLIGSESTVQIKTSAIKTAYRENNVRLVIDGAAIEGPLLENSKSRGDIYTKIRNIEVHYSTSPNDDDLDRLLSLITPSGDKYDQEDDIMVDTLLRQRRKGGVLRLTIGHIQAGAKGLQWIPHLTKVADEISKLSSVTKYLPEDDRPGVLIFALVQKVDLNFDVDEQFGPLQLKADLIEAAHINLPSLAAAQVTSWTMSRSGNDVLIGEVVSQSKMAMGPPMFMCRFIADEMEPTVRMKISNTCLEYKVPTLVALISLLDRLKTAEDSAGKQVPSSQPSSPSASNNGDASNLARKVKFSLAFRDSAVALNPHGSPAKGLFVLTDAVIRHEDVKGGSMINLDIKKASLLIIDDGRTAGQDTANVDHKLYFEENDQIQQLARAGFVPVGTISSASAIVDVVEDRLAGETRLDVEFRNNLLFIETCADSTQTLIQILGGLAPPTSPSKVDKFRTEIVPIEDMLASFTGNAFVSEPGPELGLTASKGDSSGYGVKYDEEEEEENYMADIYAAAEDADDEMTASHVESDLGRSTMAESVHVAPVNATGAAADELNGSIMVHSMLDFRTDHFAPKTDVGGTAHRWNSTQNTYGLASDSVLKRSPLKVRVRDVHVIWNLFDGYDWQATRDTISQAVKDIEAKAMARRPRSSSRNAGGEAEEEAVIGDFLFNSIYIGIPANKDPRELTNAINHDIDDMVSETGSYATGTTVTAATARRHSGPAPPPKRLKLNRSKHHKMAFELEGISADFVAFPPGSGEVESSVDIRVKKLEVFDHIPTSTWKKFATYMQDAGEREVGTSMVHVELLNVRPVADLAASEMVLKLSVLPLRLHVDQDALDFMSRFFEFKDDRIPASGSPSNPPFLQRVEVNAIPVKLDFKPKRVDYGGLRSGRTTEFMNFFVLDRADMVLRRVILYGVSGFERLGIMLNNIWTPDVKRNQLPGVLAGLAPIRPLVDVSSGVRDLITVPIREYRKDGRLVRSIQKGAVAFAKTTATELVNFGAKLAIGTQQVLQNTEDLLGAQEQRDEGDPDDEATKQISLYADQPVGITQGLRIAYGALERDLLIAKDAIVAIPGEVMASGSAKGAAKAILKQSPTIILRPAIGATKAVGQTLMGAGNTLDKQNLRRMDEKYKRH
ncbi:Autophagy-related protein 2 [Exophiala dermatitidis]